MSQAISETEKVLRPETTVTLPSGKSFDIRALLYQEYPRFDRLLAGLLIGLSIDGPLTMERIKEKLPGLLRNAFQEEMRLTPGRFESVEFYQFFVPAMDCGQLRMLSGPDARALWDAIFEFDPDPFDPTRPSVLAALAELLEILERVHAGMTSETPSTTSTDSSGGPDSTPGSPDSPTAKPSTRRKSKPGTKRNGITSPPSPSPPAATT